MNFELSVLNNARFTTKIWGGRQAELLVAQQAQALLTDEHKALPPAELQALVKDLLSCSPYYAEAVSLKNILIEMSSCGQNIIIFFQLFIF